MHFLFYITEYYLKRTSCGVPYVLFSLTICHRLNDNFNIKLQVYTKVIQNGEMYFHGDILYHQFLAVAKVLD